MLALKRIWTEMDSKTIANCWRHTEIVGIHKYIDAAVTQDDEVQL